MSGITNAAFGQLRKKAKDAEHDLASTRRRVEMLEDRASDLE